MFLIQWNLLFTLVNFLIVHLPFPCLRFPMELVQWVLTISIASHVQALLFQKGLENKPAVSILFIYRCLWSHLYREGLSNLKYSVSYWGWTKFTFLQHTILWFLLQEREEKKYLHLLLPFPPRVLLWFMFLILRKVHFFK